VGVTELEVSFRLLGSGISISGKNLFKATNTGISATKIQRKSGEGQSQKRYTSPSKGEEANGTPAGLNQKISGSAIILGERTPICDQQA